MGHALAGRAPTATTPKLKVGGNPLPRHAQGVVRLRRSGTGCTGRALERFGAGIVKKDLQRCCSFG